MRIAYLHQYFNTPAMSGGTRSWEMARRLAAAGHDVDVITSVREPNAEHEPGTWFTTREGDVTVHWLPVPYTNHMSFSERQRAFLQFAMQAGRQAINVAPDVVFATSTPLTIAIPGVRAAKRSKVPLVFEVRDLWPELPIAMGALKNPLMRAAAHRLERWAYRNSEHIVALSPGMRDGVVATGVDPSRVSVIPNSCDFDIFDVPVSRGQAFRAEHAWLGDRPLIVYSGTLGPINGVDWLVRVAAEAKVLDPDVRFAIVGDGRERPRIEADARRLGVLDSNLFMLPPLPKQQMPDLLSAATIATSLFIDLEPMWANSANKFFDALASGTPPAINYGGWQKELLEEHDAGLVLDPHDVTAAARTLLSRARDAQWCERTGERARRLGRENFDRDDLAAQLCTVLESAAGVRSGVVV